MSLGALSVGHFAPGHKNEDFNSLWNQMRCRNITNNKNNLITPPLGGSTPPPQGWLSSNVPCWDFSKSTHALLSGQAHLGPGTRAGSTQPPDSNRSAADIPDRARREAWSLSLDPGSPGNRSTLLPRNNKEASYSATAAGEIRTREEKSIMLPDSDAFVGHFDLFFTLWRQSFETNCNSLSTNRKDPDGGTPPHACGVLGCCELVADGAAPGRSLRSGILIER